MCNIKMVSFPHTSTNLRRSAMVGMGMRCDVIAKNAFHFAFRYYNLHYCYATEKLVVVVVGGTTITYTHSHKWVERGRVGELGGTCYMFLRQ